MLCTEYIYATTNEINNPTRPTLLVVTSPSGSSGPSEAGAPRRLHGCRAGECNRPVLVVRWSDNAPVFTWYLTSGNKRYNTTLSPSPKLLRASYVVTFPWQVANGEIKRGLEEPLKGFCIFDCLIFLVTLLDIIHFCCPLFWRLVGVVEKDEVFVAWQQTWPPSRRLVCFHLPAYTSFENVLLGKMTTSGRFENRPTSCTNKRNRMPEEAAHDERERGIS